MWRGIRYRRGRSVVVWLLATVAVAAAVLVPAYLRAAQQSVLADELAAAPPSATGVTVAAAGTAAAAPAAHRPLAEVRAAADRAVADGPVLPGVLDPPVAGVDTETLVASAAAAEPVAARLAYRDRVCDLLTVAGACPAGAGELLVSDRTAADTGIGVGDPVTVTHAGGVRREATVVGTYTPVDPGDRRWARTVYFTYGGFDPVTGAPRVDAVFTGSPSGVTADRAAEVRLGIAYPLRPGAVDLDRVTGLRAELGGLAGAGALAGLTVETSLPSILDRAAAEADALAGTVPVLAVPLLLLALLVLGMLVAAVTDERAPELALAALRGYPRRRMARFGLGEVTVLVLAAVPAGLGLGLAAVALAARVALAPGTPVEPRWPVWLAATATVVVTLPAAALAARGTLNRPVLELLRRVPRRSRRRAGLVEGAVAALAVASLVVAAGDPAHPLALLAPALAAALAGLVVARLVRAAARFRLRRLPRRTAGIGAIPRLLAAAQLGRRPAGARVVVVGTVAVALLAFAALAWDTAATARHDRAVDLTGADRVYQVRADHPAALLAAVRAAAPTGAAAVVRVTDQYAGAPVALLGVDVPRMAEVVRWRGHGPAALADLAGALRPREPSPLPLAGRVAVTAEVSGLPAAGPVRLTALVSAPGRAPRAVPLGTLDPAVPEYAADLPDCPPAAGCRLRGLGLGRTGAAAPFTAALAVTAIHSGNGALAARLDEAGAWSAPSGATIEPGSGLAVAVTEAAGGEVLLAYQDTVPALPAVVAGPAPADDPDATDFTFPGLAERPEPVTVVARAGRLPAAGGRGLLFDLEYAVAAAERGAALDAGRLRYEVWAGPAAPPDLPRRLAAAGVAVTRADTLAGTEARLARLAPGLALWLALLTGGAAAALAIGVVALAAWAGRTDRRRERAALLLAGVTPALLRRARRREQAPVLAALLLVGAGVGLAAAALLLPGVPLVETGVTGSGAPRPGTATLVAAAVTVAGLALVALPAARPPRGGAGEAVW